MSTTGEHVRNMKDKFLYVRLKPFDPQNGFKCKRYSLLKFNVTLRSDSGWLRVPISLGKFIEKLTQDPNNPKSPPLADVCTRQQANEVERLEIMERRKIVISTDMTIGAQLTADQIDELRIAELEKLALEDMGMNPNGSVDEDATEEELEVLSSIRSVSSTNYDNSLAGDISERQLETEILRDVDEIGVDTIHSMAEQDVSETIREETRSGAVDKSIKKTTKRAKKRQKKVTAPKSTKGQEIKKNSPAEAD
jgi:hypothetical protein